MAETMVKCPKCGSETFRKYEPGAGYAIICKKHDCTFFLHDYSGWPDPYSTKGLPLFDDEAGRDEREIGMLRAASVTSRASTLDEARKVAIDIAKKRGSVTADDIVEEFERWGDNLPEILGNAMGSIFLVNELVWNGNIIHSRRVSRHANMIRVWVLRDGYANG